MAGGDQALAPQPSLDTACLFCFQLTLTIVRQTGGLGISIAGGKGSTPYKGDDEVRSHPTLCCPWALPRQHTRSWRPGLGAAS